MCVIKWTIKVNNIILYLWKQASKYCLRGAFETVLEDIEGNIIYFAFLTIPRVLGSQQPTITRQLTSMKREFAKIPFDNWIAI